MTPSFADAFKPLFVFKYCECKVLHEHVGFPLHPRLHAILTSNIHEHSQRDSSWKLSTLVRSIQDSATAWMSIAKYVGVEFTAATREA